MKISGYIRSLLRVMILLSLCCCATPQTPKITCVRDGMEYGRIRGNFREKFWSYYERGLSYSEGQCFDAAIADFKSAIELHQQDQRKARTYGVEFIDYFPHRELGKIYFETGDLESARKELEISVSQYPSAKARFYLDQVRKTLIERQRSEIYAPRLDLETQNDLRIRDNSVVVSGRAEDENYVAVVKINGIPYLSEAIKVEDDPVLSVKTNGIPYLSKDSEKRISFKQAITLSEGENRIEVEAENIFGKKSSKEIIVYSDRQGPMITVEKMDSGNGQVMISGYLYDDAGVSELLINKQPVFIRKDIDTYFILQVPINMDKIELTAKDSLGNETAMHIPVPPILGSNTPILIANSYLIMGDAIAPLKDSSPLRIELMGGLTDRQTVYHNELYVQAVASDDNSMIESLKIRGKSIFRTKGKRICFGGMIDDLDEGENRIVIEASDSAGNTAKKELIVIKKVPDYLAPEQRLTISVSSDKSNKNIVKDTFDKFKNYLKNAFVQNGRFNYVEKEGTLGDIELGIRIVYSFKELEIIGEMKDKDGNILFEDINLSEQEMNDSVLEKLAKGIANICIRKYPFLTGEVQEKNGNQILTSIGRKKAESYGGKGAKISKNLIIYSGKFISGYANIHTTGEDDSVAMIENSQHYKPDSIKPSVHKVVTR